MELNINKSNIKLYNNDSLSILDNIADCSINLAICDPPYGISYNNKFHSPTEKNWDKFGKGEYHKFTVEWLNKIYNKLMPNGTLWCFFGPTMIHEMFDAIKCTQFTNHLENWAIYARDSGRGSTKKLKSVREDIFHLTKDPKNYVWNSTEWLRLVIAPYKLAGGIKRGWDNLPDGQPARWTSSGNVLPFLAELEYDKKEAKLGTILDLASGLPMRYSGLDSNVTYFACPSYNNKFDTQQHTCQKPILLLSMLTMISSNAGDQVIDSFMGSGASAIASIITERNYIGIEREKETFNKAVNWIKNFDYKLADKYFKGRISSSEKGFKFGFHNRNIMKKSN